MKNFFSKINFYVQPLFLSGLFFAFCLIIPFPVEASTDHNVRGYARLPSSDSYISFNCLDDGNGGKFPFNFPIHFSVPTCSLNDHGVNIASNGNFSGKAWHYIFGDIDFETSTSSPIETPDGGAFRTHCLDCTAAAGCSACLVKSAEGEPGLVYGYARVTGFVGNSAENNGWVKLDGLTINSFLSGAPGNFHGVIDSSRTPASIGEVRFNCQDNNSCNTDLNKLNWRTYIWPLWVGEMSAPNWSFDSACTNGALGASLKWQLSSGKQKKWEIIVSDNSTLNTSTPFFTDSSYGSAGSYNCSSFSSNCNLAYGDSFYWWLKLWYSVNDSDPEDEWLETPWIRFDHSPTGMGKIVFGSDEYADDYSFATYKSEFPNFWYETSASPTPITIGTSTEFTAYAEYFTPTQPTTPINCTPPNCTYLWYSDDSSALFNPYLTSEQRTTQGIFVRPTSTMIIVEVTDPNGYRCSRVTDAGEANFAMPLWREVKVKKDAISQ